MEDNKTEVDSSTTDVNQDSSTEKSNQSEDATSSKATETPFNEHPRFKEIIAEKNEYKQRAHDLEAKLYESMNRTVTPQVQADIQEQLYQANTPEEKHFWQTVEKVADKIADKKLAVKEKEYRQEISGLYQQYGQLSANEFLKSHDDIKRGSDELKEIVTIASKRGLDLDEAYKIVMFDKNVQRAAEGRKEKEQSKMHQKVAANVETKSTQSDAIPKKKIGERITMEDLELVAKEHGVAF